MADLELRTAPETDYADTNIIPFGKAAPGSGLFRGTLSALRTALLAGASLLPPLAGNAGKALFVKSDESGVEWDTVSGGGGGGGTPVTVTRWVIPADGTAASQDITDARLTGLTVDDVIVNINGVFQLTTDYSITGDTLTITTNAAGDKIEIHGFSVSGSGGGSGGGSTPTPPDITGFTRVTGSPIINATSRGLLIRSNSADPAGTVYTMTRPLDHAGAALDVEGLINVDSYDSSYGSMYATNVGGSGNGVAYIMGLNGTGRQQIYSHEVYADYNNYGSINYMPAYFHYSQADGGGSASLTFSKTSANSEGAAQIGIGSFSNSATTHIGFLLRKDGGNDVSMLIPYYNDGVISWDCR
jgi:hypothetical protein